MTKTKKVWAVIICGIMMLMCAFLGMQIRTVNAEISLEQMISRLQEKEYTATIDGEEVTMQYRLYIPEDYDASKSYPMITMLHGHGGQGDDNTTQLNVFKPLLTKLGSDENLTNNPAILLIPQCRLNHKWVEVTTWTGHYSIEDFPISRDLQAVANITEQLMTDYSVDDDRMYITGHSMGGLATWDMLGRYPDRYAAAIPIAGAGNDPTIAESIKDVNIWAVHGTADTVVDVDVTRTMVEALEKVNGNILYRETAEDHSNGTTTYTDCDVVDFMFCSQKGVANKYFTDKQEYAAVEDLSASGSFAYVNNVSNTAYNGAHYSSHDAVSVNFPSTSVGGMLTLKFTFASTDMTGTNKAIRMRISEVVPVTGRESLRFDLVGSATTNMKTSSTIYKEQNGTITTATVSGSGTSAATYVIDTAEVNGSKTFDGYVILPLSIYNVTPSAITGLQIRTNALYTKGIWNFGEIEFGTVDASGNFTKESSLWTPYKEDGSVNTYTSSLSNTNSSDTKLTELVKIKVIRANTFDNNKHDLWTSSSHDALSVNFPTTALSGITTLKFPFASTTDMTGDNKAIRMRISEVVPVTGRESLRFDLVGSATTNMTTSSTIYKEQNGTITTATVSGSGTGAAAYVIDTAEVNGNKTFDGYVILPLSIYNVTPSAITALQIRTNPLYTKGIWNFGEIEFGTVDASGNFTKESSLWTPYKEDGSANTYTADNGAVAKIIKGGTAQGTAVYFKSNFVAGSTENVNISNYKGIVISVDNTENETSIRTNMQFYMFSSELAAANAQTPSYGWITKNGLATFIPDDDCTAYKNSFSTRSQLIPAGFKGKIFIPFTLNSEQQSGCWEPRENAPETFPTEVYNQYFIAISAPMYSSLRILDTRLVGESDIYVNEAFESVANVNLTLDEEKAIYVETEKNVAAQFEFWSKSSEMSVQFSECNQTNEDIQNGSALAVRIRNLNNSSFVFSLTTFNKLGDYVLLGGNTPNATVKLVQEDGTVQNLDMSYGHIIIPANADGTLVISYTGGLDCSTAKGQNETENSYFLGYPVKGVSRLIFNIFDRSGAVSILLGDVAIVKEDGSYTTITINGESWTEIVSTSDDGEYKKERAFIVYSGLQSEKWNVLLKPTMTTGASIRLKANTANSGLRFESNYDQEVIAAVNAEIAKGNGQIKSVSYGTLIVPKDYLSDTVAPTFASLSAAGKNYLDVESSGFHSTSTATTAKYWGAIIDVLPSNYEREFVGLGYAKLIMADDSVVYVYADYLETNVRSIATVAQAAYNDRNSTQDSKYEYATNDGDYSPFTKAELEMLNGYIPTSTASYASVVLAEGNANYAATTRKWQGVPGVEVTADNRLWATFFTGGEQEPSNDNYIVVSYSDDRGTTWKEPFFCIGHSGSTVRAYDPSLWIDPQGKLWITWCQANTYSNMKTWAIVIDNPDADGTALKEQVQNATPRLLFDGVKLNKFLALSNGDWLAFTASSNPTDITVQASTNQGGSWSVRSMVSGGGLKVTEPMAVETENGKLLLLTRIEATDGEISGGISKATSDDYGKTWTVAQGGLANPLRGPSSRFALVKLASGNLLLINHNNETYRRHLTAYLSTDGGNTWGNGLLLTGEDTQVSYPDIAQGADGTIYVIYDRGRYTVKEINIVLITETNGTLSKGEFISVSNLEDSVA